MKQYLLATLLSLASIVAYGQSPQLVEDIWAGTQASNPQRLTMFNNKLYFTAMSATYGRELWEWQAMGTPATRVTDLFPGTGDGTPGNSGEFPMYVYKGKLYFYGRPAINQTRLMVYDGTTPPGYILTVNGGSAPVGMTEYAGKMYFVADSAGSHPGYLYSYNITSAPVLIGKTNIAPSNWLTPLISYKGKLYFALNTGWTTGTYGTELGSFDSATGKISLVADIYTGTYNGTPNQFTVYGDKLYFTAGDSAHGNELYSYDGTTVKRLSDVIPGPTDGATFTTGLGTIVGFKGSIYFSGQRSVNHHALYKYDTASKAVMLAYDPAPGLYSNSAAVGIYATPKNVYFYYNHPTTGSELYQYNGTSGKLVADLNPGTANGAGFSNLLRMGSYVYFSGSRDTMGMELYRLSDGEYTGIENTAWSGKAVIHPNPVTTSATLSITVQDAQSLRIEITDVAGRIVHTTGTKSFSSGTNDVTIPMQNLTPGQYFYRVSGNGGSLLASGAVIKQ